jgi:hypothetical protein
MNRKTVNFVIATLGSVLVAGASQAAGTTVTQSIEPAVIRIGETAHLTLSESGDSPLTPPMVAGLEFVATGQSQRMESINGVSSTSTSVTYEVIPQQAGVFTIPSPQRGAQPLVLTVNPASASGAAQGGRAVLGSSPASSPLPAGASRMTADGSAFVRMRLPTRELYVGETVPVEIQVGMRDGLVASLNGLPTLNGDAFTLNKLSSEPVRTEEVIDGKPFTVLSWHSTLAAVKPGTLSLTIETPLTVRMRARSAASLAADAGLGDLFDDPIFQNFFGGTTEKEVTVASAPITFSVLGLPLQNRPANFSGAVGHFSVSGGITNDQAAVGDPITLRMQVSGEGSFDRVNSPMLRGAPDWKTYAPTAAFKAADETGYRGVKTFEQPLIATRAGTDNIPEVGFSWFDPTTKRYVEAHTAPMSVSISPAAAGEPAAARATPLAALPDAASARNSSANTPAASDGLRADHAPVGGGPTTLLPHYYQPLYVAAPAALLLAMSGSLLWVRRRERLRTKGEASTAASLEPYVKLMEEASVAHDPELFFKSARTALQISLAERWGCAPDKVTQETIAAHLGSDSGISRLFELADDAAYSGVRDRAANLRQWKPLVQHYLKGEARV